MFLAAEQTIGHRLLQLPYGTQPLLECLGILELGDLLELVDADDDIATFLLRYLFGELQDFINQSYTSKDLTIAMLAEKFHVSIAYMSYLFKKYFNEYFSDYLWKLRVAKAKELLGGVDSAID